MRKVRTFEENHLHNFQMQEQQPLQLQSLKLTPSPSASTFPSVAALISPHSQLSIIGDDPNSHIRAFFYLLLCGIRKQHYRRLISRQKQQDILSEEARWESERSSNPHAHSPRKQRKMSFNGSGLLFVDRSMENFALHRLKLFAFPNDIDLTLITNTPLQTDKLYFHRGQPLKSHHMKKLIAQFLAILIPSRLPQNYHQSLCSTQQILNISPILPILFSILMRHILCSRYEIESARDYHSILHEHTICTALCDAFAIDGLICKDQFYQIERVCRVHTIDTRSGKMIFVELMDDQIEESSKLNEKRKKTMKLIEEMKERERAIKELEESKEKSQYDVSEDSKMEDNPKETKDFEANTPDFDQFRSVDFQRQMERFLFPSERVEAPPAQESDKDAGLPSRCRMIRSIQVSDSSASQQNNFRQTFNTLSLDFQNKLLSEISAREEELKAISTQKRASKDSTTENSSLVREIKLSKGEQIMKPAIQSVTTGRDTTNSNLISSFNKHSSEQLEQSQYTSGEFMQRLTGGRSREVKITRIGFREDPQSDFQEKPNKAIISANSTNSSLPSSSESINGSSHFPLARPSIKQEAEEPRTIITYGSGFTRIHRVVNQ